MVDGNTTKYFLDGSNVIADFDGDDVLLATYVTPGLDANLSQERGGSTYYYMADGLGSIRNLVDANEATQNTYDYYAFGKELGTWTENITNRYTYTAREYDPESTQYYYRARYYNGGGRFFSRDALEPYGYLYVANIPLLRTDPWGLKDYEIGSGPRPTIEWDNGYPYDPNAQPTAADYANWAKYGVLLNTAELLGHIPDATRAYRHYREASGTDLIVNYNKAIKGDSNIDKGFEDELLGAMLDIERLHDGKTPQFSVYSTSARLVGSATENWQKALGGHRIWGTGNVTYDPSCRKYTLKIIVYMEDFYNFNKGQVDIVTGLPDDQNGRFEVFGWADSFYSRGQVTRTVTWTRGRAGTDTQTDSGAGR